MAFHYRTICCSRSCAQVYLERVLEARGKLKSNDEITEADNTSIVSNVVALEESPTTVADDNTPEAVQEKPKRKYVRKKAAEAEEKNDNEESEQID